MKKMAMILTLICATFCCASAQNAPPSGIVYQAIARDKMGAEVAAKQIAVKFSIHKSSTNGQVVWEEEHKATTNQFGLFTITIGEGNPVTGNTTLPSFSKIAWNEASYFLEVLMDVNAGSNYLSIGTTQFMSVPYALYALNSGSSLPGPKGEKGDTGSAGAKGDNGSDGLKGDKGDTGLKGDTGIQGLKGDKGDVGLKGDTGIQGIKGDAGAIGNKGERGDIGPKGDAGIAGAKGDKGETGLKGEQGNIGPKGADGLKGDNGLSGKNGISISWKGNLPTAPADSINYAYYNTVDKKSYIYNGNSWQILAQDGKFPTGLNNGETAFWNGSDWIVNGFLTNTGKAIGMGTNVLYGNNILTFKDGHLSSKQTVSPTIKVSNVSNPPIYKLDATSTDTKGFITYQGSTGNHPNNSSAKLTVTFVSSYETPPAVMIMPANKAIKNYVFYYVVSSTTGFDLYIDNEGSAISGGFQFYYFVIE